MIEEMMAPDGCEENTAATEEQAPAPAKEPEAPVVLNRAQRRALAKYIQHSKAAQQLRRAQRQKARTTPCSRCGIPFFTYRVPYVGPVRCQCKATIKQRPGGTNEPEI